jgi:hypothetical protein
MTPVKKRHRCINWMNSCLQIRAFYRKTGSAGKL